MNLNEPSSTSELLLTAVRRAWDALGERIRASKRASEGGRGLGSLTTEYGRAARVEDDLT